MTMVASGQIDLGGTVTVGGFNQSIQQEYGYGTNLNAYRGKLYTNAAVTTATPFPNTSNPISMSVFYSTRKIPTGSQTYTNGQSGSFTIPPYNSITITVAGAGGGGSGGYGTSGNQGCTASAGSAGGAGQGSYFDTSASNAWYRTASGGGGGSISGTGSTGSGNDGTQGGGGAAGGPGGQGPCGYGGGPAYGGGVGGRSTITLSNPLLGGGGPPTGNAYAYLAGYGGNTGGYGYGGAGGQGVDYNYYQGCYAAGGCSGSKGGDSAAGYVTITWS